MNTKHYQLPDTRPYPNEPIKNELLVYASQIAKNTSKPQTTLARENLQTSITEMLATDHYVGLSVALSMAANPDVYHVLWSSLNNVLMAHKPQEIQWVCLPVVVVAGSKKKIILPHHIDMASIDHVFSSTTWYQQWMNIKWLPHLLHGSTLTAIKAHQWFNAKQTQQTAHEFLHDISMNDICIEEGQSVQVFYLLGYAPQDIQSVLGVPLDQIGLPLMQAWHTYFQHPEITAFTNPLPLLTPLEAIREGSAMRLRMACDVFTTNAIRSIRLQSPRVGVVIASQTGGRLLFGFNATDSAFELAPQIFTWPLSSMDHIDTIIQNFLNLLVECQVENIRILHEPIDAQDILPTYASAQHLLGHNPLFAEYH